MYGHQAGHKPENRYTDMLGLRLQHLTYVLCKIYIHLKFSSCGNKDGVEIYIYFFGKFVKCLGEEIQFFKIVCIKMLKIER